MTPITYLIQNQNRIPINTLDYQASTFGMLGSGEISQTNIFQLFVTDVAAITNIRLALIDTGGIVFDNSIFGVETRGLIDTVLLQNLSSKESATKTQTLALI